MAAKTASTCVNTAQGTLPGFGAPIQSAFDQATLAATGTITVPIPAPGITKGKIRIQTSGVNAATTTAIGAITATDGTTTVQVGATARVSTTAAGVAIDLISEFVLGINATSFSFAATLAGATTAATVNTEIFGNP